MVFSKWEMLEKSCMRDWLVHGGATLLKKFDWNDC